MGADRLFTHHHPSDVDGSVRPGQTIGRPLVLDVSVDLQEYYDMI